MEKISWTEKITNEAVLKIVGERPVMVDMIIRRKKNWIGHVVRGDGLLREVIEGKWMARGREEDHALACWKN